MGHSTIMLILLVMGMLVSVDAQFFSKTVRPEYPLHAREGCSPGGQTTASCPVRTDCFVDKNFKNGGRCDCNPLWFKTPAKLPFDDNEWDDGLTTSDCVDHHLSRFLISMSFVFIFLSSVACIYTTAIVLRELIRVKALKWNATATSLFSMIWLALGSSCCGLIYTLPYWGLDRKEFWWESRSVFFVWFTGPGNVVVDFEIVATWIDLYDRTKKMSKSTSRNLKVLRAILRLLAAFEICMGYIINMGNSLFALLVQAIGPSVVGFILIGIGGRLIVKTICPDRKDISNPNWKVAESIRRATLHTMGARFIEVVGLLGMAVTAKHPALGYLYGLFNAVYWLGYILRLWAWLHYSIYANRKFLKSYSSENASAYFGFLTIGLRTMFTKRSSVVGTRSSAMSSVGKRSSVVAGPSTVDKD